MGGRRRFWLVLVAALAAVPLAACGDGDDESAPQLPGVVRATEMLRFDPDEFSVRFGRETSFTFENDDDEREHNFTLSYVFVDADNFVNVDVGPNQSEEVRFTVRERPEAGFLTFYCRFHQHEGMSGRIRLI